MITSIQKTISNKPWLLIVATFVVLIAIWTGFIILAVKNQPQNLPSTVKPDTTDTSSPNP